MAAGRKAAYRVGQFLRYLRPKPLEAGDHALVEGVLPPRLAELFYRMGPGEQAHAVRVLRAVLAAGSARPELLQAALLHDVGKIRARLSVPERVAAVLARWLAPRRSARWGRQWVRSGGGLGRALAVAEQHPEWGADLCAEAGASPLVVRLVRGHQAPVEVATAATDEGRLRRALQRADDDA